MNCAITAIAPWFGSKRTLAPTIVQQLGPHAAYWEPFCGSMSVLLAKPPSAQESVNDLHGDLINLAMVVASDRYAELYERLQRVLYCEGLFDWSKDIFQQAEASPPASPAEVAKTHVDRAYVYMIVSWIGRNGVAGTTRSNHQMAIRWTSGGGSGAIRFSSAVESLPDWHRRLRSVMILRRDAFDLLERIDDADGTAIYLDPPYLMHTRGDGGGVRYEHDFLGPEHKRLADAAQRFKRARVVVSYYSDPAIDNLYPGWTVLDCARHKHLHVQNRRGMGRKEAPEILVINGPIFGAGGLFEGA